MATELVVTNDLFPENREPVDTGEATRWIHEALETGRRSALQAAVLIAHVHDAYYADEPGAWLSWCREEFGYARRTAFNILKAGKTLLILGVRHDALRQCDVEKCVAIGALYEAKPEQCHALLDAWNPAEHTRDEVRQKVASFIEGTKECEECGTEFEPTKRTQKLCEVCLKKRQEKKTQRKSRSVDKVLGDVAGLDEPQKQALCGEIAPGVAMRAGLNSIELAFMSIEKHGGWSHEDFAHWETRLAEIVESFRYLASK